MAHSSGTLSIVLACYQSPLHFKPLPLFLTSVHLSPNQAHKNPTCVASCPSIITTLVVFNLLISAKHFYSNFLINFKGCRSTWAGPASSYVDRAGRFAVFVYAYVCIKLSLAQMKTPFQSTSSFCRFACLCAGAYRCERPACSRRQDQESRLTVCFPSQ